MSLVTSIASSTSGSHVRLSVLNAKKFCSFTFKLEIISLWYNYKNSIMRTDVRTLSRNLLFCIIMTASAS